jgi:hypothetical protein
MTPTIGGTINMVFSLICFQLLIFQGGGTDVDLAFKFLIKNSGGGDILVFIYF